MNAPISRERCAVNRWLVESVNIRLLSPLVHRAPEAALLAAIVAVGVLGGQGSLRDLRLTEQQAWVNAGLVQARALRQQIDDNLAHGRPRLCDGTRPDGRMQEVQVSCDDGRIGIQVAAAGDWPALSMQLRRQPAPDGRVQWRCHLLSRDVTPAVPLPCLP